LIKATDSKPSSIQLERNGQRTAEPQLCRDKNDTVGEYGCID